MATDLRVVKKSELIEHEGQIRSSKIGWNHGAALDYLLRNKHRFVKIDEFCRVFWGSARTKENRRRVRKNLTPLFKYALHNNGLIIVVEPDNSRGRAGAVKVLDKTSGYEQSLVGVKTKKMLRAREINEVDYQLVLQLAAPEEPPATEIVA